MEEKPLISIIVPVYNVEKYLEQCIQSIVGQTFRRWELLLIDDGSTDGSGKICDKFAEHDKRIKVVHKQNSGQADSRNVALEMATTDIIGYVDADDWIEPDMYEVLYDTMIQNDADVSMCGFYWSYKTEENVDKKGRRRKKWLPSSFKKDKYAYCKEGDTIVFTREEAVKLILEDKVIKSYLWDKLFRRSVINTDMPKSLYYEDFATLFKWLMTVNKVAYSCAPKYHYRQRISSTVNDNDPKKKFHYFLAAQERFKYFNEKDFGIFNLNQKKLKSKVVFIGTKASKEIARRSKDEATALTYIGKIKEKLEQYMPIRISDIGLKAYWRLMILNISIPFYYKLMRFTGIFVTRNLSKKKNIERYYE